jgi:hypothetical protein
MSADAQRIALQVIDYGCALFQVANAVRPERRVRDLVTAALLRRAVVTVEGIRALVFAGLMEPALSVSRTLMDIELSMKLVLRDKTDQKAHALAASHYLQYQLHGQEMLGNTPTREGMLGSADRIVEVRQIAKSYAAFLESPVFDGVRAELKADRFWHGFDRPEDAFRDIGQEAEYFMTYDSASWFVHGSNVDHDIIDGVGQTITFRPFIDRDPGRIQNVLGLALLKSLELYELFCSDKEIDLDAATGAEATVHIDGLQPERISSITALRGFVMKEFDVRPDSPFRPGSP